MCLFDDSAFAQIKGQMSMPTDVRKRAIVRNRTPYMGDPVLIVTDAQIMAARQWAADCEWADAFFYANSQEYVETLSDREVVNGVDRYYDGGWPQFIADGLA